MLYINLLADTLEKIKFNEKFFSKNTYIYVYNSTNTDDIHA